MNAPIKVGRLNIHDAMPEMMQLEEDAADGFHTGTRALHALTRMVGELDELGGIAPRDMGSLLEVIYDRLDVATEKFVKVGEALRRDLPALLQTPTL